MQKVKIKNEEYYFEKDYRDDEKLRRSFIELAKKTFWVDFEEWYENGYWKKERFIQYSIIEKDSVVANVSVYIMNFNILGEDKLCVQLGGVMTDENYRGRGLSRFLIEKIISEWKDKSDMIYLFANDSVLDFYPKFGFKKEDEYIFYKTIDLPSERMESLDRNVGAQPYIKLNMDCKEEREFLYNKAMSSSVNSKLAMVKGSDLVMFYCISIMKDEAYYFDDINTIAIAEVEDDNLFINAVYSDAEADLDDIIERLTNEKIRRVTFGFTPKNTSSYSCELFDEEDTTLFILGGSELFKKNKIKFEPLSHT